jgi:hypothetical protein
LIDDKEGCHESMQDMDAEADVLQALVGHRSRVKEDHSIAKAEEGRQFSKKISDDYEASDEEEKRDGEEMSNEDGSSVTKEDKKSKVNKGERDIVWKVKR